MTNLFGRVPVHFSNCSGRNSFNFYIYFWISLRNFTDHDVWPPFRPRLFLQKMQKLRKLKWRPNIMISKIFRWNPKIYIKIERISPRAIKKVDGHPPKSWPQCWQFWTLDDYNVSCWADGTNPIMDFESWALGLSSPMTNKKKFSWLLWKKMSFFEILHVNISPEINGENRVSDISRLSFCRMHSTYMMDLMKNQWKLEKYLESQVTNFWDQFLVLEKHCS